MEVGRPNFVSDFGIYIVNYCSAYFIREPFRSNKHCQEDLQRFTYSEWAILVIFSTLNRAYYGVRNFTRTADPR